jgi:two-component system LytT family response regulator
LAYRLLKSSNVWRDASSLPRAHVAVNPLPIDRTRAEVQKQTAQTTGNPTEKSKVIRTILADDEVLARHKLRELLRDEPEVEIAGEASTAAETIDLVRATAPDLLFLDIRMPGMDGFDIVGKLAGCEGVSMPRIIFTTAYDGYALRAFDIHALDYLLKPFAAQRFRAAVQRAREQLELAGRNGNGNGKGHGWNEGPHSTRMVFKSRGRILFLPVSEIRWIGAEENYIRISTGTETHLLRETMARIEERLDPGMFLRVHRSAIVNLQYVKEVRTSPQGEFTVVLVNGQKVSMSRSYHARIGELMAHR